MTREPRLPPGPWIDLTTGRPTEAFRRFMEGERTQTTSVLSGVAQAQAAATAAQATATTAQTNAATAQTTATTAQTTATTAQASAAVAQQTAIAASTTAQDVADAALSFSVALSTPVASVLTTSVGLAATNSVTATPSGGTGPYTYAWAKVEGDTVTVTSPTAATTTFSATLLAGGSFLATYRVTVTDSLSATATASVGVTLTHLG